MSYFLDEIGLKVLLKIQMIMMIRNRALKKDYFTKHNVNLLSIKSTVYSYYSISKRVVENMQFNFPPLLQFSELPPYYVIK